MGQVFGNPWYLMSAVVFGIDVYLTDGTGDLGKVDNENVEEEHSKEEPYWGQSHERESRIRVRYETICDPVLND